MTALEAAHAYFNAWIRRDAPGIVAAFAPGGTYEDPATRGPLSGDAIAAYASGLFAAFPDLGFELASFAEGADGLVAAEWIMTGTNSGSFLGLPPTGKKIRVTGSDFIRVENGKLRSVTGYFDSGALPRQLGLQVIVQPDTLGPYRFGTAVAGSTGKTTKPGAISLTQLRTRSPEEIEKVRAHSMKITQELLEAPGFIGMRGVTVGDLMLTLTAWESPEAPRQLLAGGTHSTAMKDFFGTEIASGGYTSVWVPARINANWVRCPGCQKMADRDKSATCGCGAALPEAPPYL